MALANLASIESVALAERAPDLGCEPAAASDSDPAAAIAAVACDPADEAVTEVTLNSFVDPDVMRDAWTTDPLVATDVPAADDACITPEPGTRQWGFGDVTCLVREDGTAEIRWTDSRIGMLGRARSGSDDIPELYGWWQEVGRKIGQTGDTATEEPKDVTPETKGKLVRVPGAPKKITCESGDPVPDEWDRAWRLKNVRFQNKNGYERVIINLERTGENRTKWPTRAQVKRTLASKVPDVVPNASQPGLGRQAFVVQLDGVRDAPNINRYRPNDLVVVKEVSVVKSGPGRAVIITAPKGTCYQMRIPVWGPNATGSEQKSEVYIDLKAP